MCIMNLCRICLKTPANKAIVELETAINENNKNYFEIMVFCLNIKVTEDSKITTKLCSICYRKIISFYKFKALALKNDAYLKSFNPDISLDDQKLSVYVDENGIKHENPLETDDYGSSIIEEGRIKVKIEVDVKNENISGDEDVDNKNSYVEIQINDMDEDTLEDIEQISVRSQNEKTNKIKVKATHKKLSHQAKEVTLEYQMCVQCGKHVRNLKEHLVCHLPKGERKKLPCKVPGCPKLFFSLRGQKYHYKTAHKGIKYKCDICNKEVSNVSQHKRHSHNRSTLPLGDIQKDAKDEDTPSQSGSGSGCQPKEPKLGYQMCDECGMPVRNLKEHSLRHQPKEKRRMLPCKVPECPKLFLSKHGQKYHYKTAHLGFKFKCDICDKEVSNLSQHKQQTHNRDALAHACACGRRFISVSALSVHMTTHTQENPFECDVCHKKYRSKAFLSNHIREIHEQEKRFQCEFCSKGFFRKQAFQDHIRKHTKERPYKCEECGKSFTWSHTLTNHRLIHQDEKKFPCERCDKSFRNAGALKTHMVSHTKEKRYPCGFCGVRFGRSDHRNRHELTAHKKRAQATDLVST